MEESRTLSSLCAELQASDNRFHHDPKKSRLLIMCLASLVQSLLPNDDGTYSHIGIMNANRNGQRLMNIMYPTLPKSKPEDFMPYNGKVAQYFENEGSFDRDKAAKRWEEELHGH